MNTLMVLAVMVGLSQDTPQDIAKKDLPKLAPCVLCNSMGEAHGEEKPAAGVKYKGTSYYFCNAKEVATFKKSPEMYTPLVLPVGLASFELKDQAGKTWDSAAMKGKLVLLDYWATWCKPCLALKPKLDKVHEKYKAQGFEVLSISIDEKKETVDKFLAKSKWTNPVLWDNKQTWVPLKVTSIPALFLVKDGQVVQAFRGGVKAEEIETAVKAKL